MGVPNRQTEARDQQAFDEAVDRKGKLFLEALAGLGILAAVIMSMVALVQSGQPGAATAAAPAAKSPAATVTTAAKTIPAAAVKTLDVKIIGGYKVAADGQKHDAFTVTDYAVKVGLPLKLRIDNTDDVPHSITAPAAGVNIIAQPGVHTYTLLVNHAGRFEWNCMLPCDTDANGWAMQNPGFMSGYITAS